MPKSITRSQRNTTIKKTNETTNDKEQDQSKVQFEEKEEQIDQENNKMNDNEEAGEVEMNEEENLFKEFLESMDDESKEKFMNFQTHKQNKSYAKKYGPIKKEIEDMFSKDENKLSDKENNFLDVLFSQQSAKGGAKLLSRMTKELKKFTNDNNTSKSSSFSQNNRTAPYTTQQRKLFNLQKNKKNDKKIQEEDITKNTQTHKENVNEAINNKTDSIPKPGWVLFLDNDLYNNNDNNTN